LTSLVTISFSGSTLFHEVSITKYNVGHPLFCVHLQHKSTVYLLSKSEEEVSVEKINVTAGEKMQQ